MELREMLCPCARGPAGVPRAAKRRERVKLPLKGSVKTLTERRLASAEWGRT